MSGSWRDLWEQRFQQKHGYPSQGPRADLERQAAFLDDILAHPTLATNFDMLSFLVGDYNNAVDEYKCSQVQRRFDEILRQALHLHEVARGAESDLNGTLLSEIAKSRAQAGYRSIYGSIRGVIRTVEALKASISRAAAIVNEKFIQQQTASVLPLQSLPPTRFHSNVSGGRSASGLYGTSHMLSHNQSSSRHVHEEAHQHRQYGDLSRYFNFLPGFELPPYVSGRFQSLRDPITEDGLRSSPQNGSKSPENDGELAWMPWKSTPSFGSLSSLTLIDEDDCDGTESFSWASSLSLDVESSVNDPKSPASPDSLPSSLPDLNHRTVVCLPRPTYAEALKFNPRSESPNLQPPSGNDTVHPSTVSSSSILFRHPFDSWEHLSHFHSYKQRADTANLKYHRIMQNHEREMHRLASHCCLPGDLHRRLPNRFEVLSLHGDSSLSAYSISATSQDDDSDQEKRTPDGPVQLRLRGGACSTPPNASGTSFTLLDIGGTSFARANAARPLLQELASYIRLRYAERFVNSRGNEYFCDIDEDYLTDRFNLTSLNTEVQYYQYALDLITDVLDIDVDDETRDQIEKSARHLYGLVHARYIVTTRGLQKMSEKFKNGDFGKCPRVSCDGQPLLPMGQHDNANVSAVKLYCARCEDLYNPKSSRHASVDGAYFGSSFHNMFFQVHPNLMPAKSQKRYEPKIFGFRVHAPATLARWQIMKREEMKELLKSEGLETGFEEEERQEDMEASEEEEDDGQDGIDDMFEGQKVVPQ